MTDAALYRAGQALAILLTLGSVAIATMANLPDLGLAPRTVAVLAVVQAVISAALLGLPQVQRPVGTVRGSDTQP